MAWWEDLQSLHTKVWNLMQIVEKPYLLKVPQLGHVVLAGRRARVLMAASGVVGMVKSGWGGCFGQEVYGMSLP